MSNVGKHLVEIGSYGLYDRGEIVGETDKTWMASYHGGNPRRVFKGANIIATDEGGLARAQLAREPHDAEVRRIETELITAKTARRVATVAALTEERNG